ncbi:hypothetical protein SAMN02745229_01731 [Butyrivibrio fibrisolvens DSM 3071]|uniref:Uncharacterized protein n=1 Tax=Butyrivibrio fibrisolvens DSM 3071 TaxID=1121131 RepID=A0A1M5YUI6_BUTFI|nr:hypothetical protein SAMN02745229_01731 [Butyrivibrio fibrisolvens DSM 3071]
MINIKTKCFFELLKEDMFTALNVQGKADNQIPIIVRTLM